MSGNQVVLTYAGDADKLIKENRRASQSTEQVAKSVGQAGTDMAGASKQTGELSGRLSKLGNITDGASTAISDAGGALQAMADFQQAGAEKAMKLARAMNDVEQAQEDAAQAVRDFNQAAIDGDQAVVDLEQANLDAAKALKDYNKAVKENGKNSDEAKQAAIDLKQAGVDVKQAHEDQAQATRDASQATIDAKAAQLDLNEANREAHPPELQQWADKLNLVSPLLTALVGIVALVTAAQWAWNAALVANPIGLVIAAVVLLVGAIVLIATKTTWFQTAWNASWGAIKSAASAVASWFSGPFVNFFVSGFNAVKGWLGKVGGWFSNLGSGIKNTFSKVTGWITAPFRSAFNAVSDAWNNTVGALSWGGWGPIPGFSAPKMPHFHTGGVASGANGGEFMAVLRAGETVNASGRSGGGVMELRVTGGGTDLERTLASQFSELIRTGALKLYTPSGRVAATRG